MDKKRIHHVLFHLHTVSGIVISVVLFIIFFAGAFTMFKEEVNIWERGINKNAGIENIDFDKIYDRLGKEYNLTGRNLKIYFLNGNQEIYVYLEKSNAPGASGKDLQTANFKINPNDYTLESYEKGYSYAEFLYRLHFLNQIPLVGLYLTGFVAFFFLLALFTGLYIHWDKIISNFVLFRPQMKWSTLWKDAHTVLGTIALPFQLIFAITGSYFCLSILVLLPANFLFNNDVENMMAKLRPERAHAPWEEVSDQKPQSINVFFNKNQKPFKDIEITSLAIENINGTNMKYKLVGELPADKKFSSIGTYTVDAYTLKKSEEQSPYQSTYVSNIQRFMVRLHYGTYGGIFIKFIYAFLAFLTCFIIISGVMIWLTARDKKNIPEKRRKFNHNVVNVYLAICLSMIPVTAMGFIAAKLIPPEFQDHRQNYYYVVYFVIWLLFTVFFIWKNNFEYSLKSNLFLGGILFLLVPVFSGILSGNWLWNTRRADFYDTFIVALFCILVGSFSLLAFYLLKHHRKNEKSLTY